MKRESTNHKIFLAAAAAIAGSAAVFFKWRQLVKRTLPAKHAMHVTPGIAAGVEIIRDRWGVPHIYAQNESDLFFAQGFVHAQDRLFQMDTFRRIGLGRLSEIVGPSALPSDRVARYFGWRRVAEAQVAGAQRQVIEAMSAYCAGVNAFIDQGVLPVEFSLLAYKPEPWRFLDTAAFGTVLAWGLAVNWETELLRARLLANLGVDKAFDLSRFAHESYQIVLPEEQLDTRLPEALLGAYQQAMENTSMGSGRGWGSNNWVISGEHTVSGRPILANDPHLPPMMPALWYENHLVGGRYQVTGFTLPGVPGVVIGHNDHVAWGFTNGFPDVQDIFIERFHPQDPLRYEFEGQWRQAQLSEEKIKVRGRKEVRQEVRFTHHGPVFSDFLPDLEGDLSLGWSAFFAHDHLRAVLEMNRAGDHLSFRESLRHWGFPSQNIVYADVQGHIGYMLPGRIPLRKKGDGLLPVPGWSGEYEWDGWIPFEELPGSLNPDEGILVTANNRVHGQAYPHLLTGEWLPDYRARRIKELIRMNAPLTIAGNARIQVDTISMQARRFLRLTLPILKKTPLTDPFLSTVVDIMSKWDGDMRPDRAEPAIYFGWLSNFSKASIVQAVGRDLARKLLKKGPEEHFSIDPFQEIASELALNWLQYGGPGWVGDVEKNLLPALQRTVATLQENFGAEIDRWQWGRLHRIEFKHPLTQIPGLGRFWKPIAVPVGGDGFTVNQADVSLQFPPEPVGIIASCRLVIDVGAWDNSLAVLPGGQSGYPASDHYQDGLFDWLDGRYHPLLFSRDRIEAAAESKLRLFPTGQKGNTAVVQGGAQKE